MMVYIECMNFQMRPYSYLVIDQQQIPPAENRRTIRGLLSEAVRKNKVSEILLERNEDYIAAKRIVDMLFPTDERYDLFVSHCHDDKNKALGVKEELEQRGYRAFVDEGSWMNVFEVMEKFQFDERVPRECNRIASHFIIMLSEALRKTIEKSDNFLLILPAGCRRPENGVLLHPSPWISMEVGAALSIYSIQQKVAVFLRKQQAILEKRGAMINASHAPRIEYEIPTKFLTKVSWEALLAKFP